ncbi:CSS-motif domain-containing protein [Vibrio mediterranei]|nr:CSS-motif domain-containing protein [Vibrio mediterranei]
MPLISIQDYVVIKMPMNTYNFPWAKTVSVLVLALFLSGGLAYLHISNEIKASAQTSVLSVDKRIDEVVSVIRQVPYDESCPDSLMHDYANLAYENERIRAVGYIRESDDGAFVCSMFGKTSLHQKYWRGESNTDVFIGWSLLTSYFPETSLVVDIDDGDKRFFAYVNPRRLVGYWLEPTLPYANYAFKLNGDLNSTYSRNPIEPDVNEMESEVSSSRYPYSITVYAAYHTLIKRMLIYWLRSIIAVAILWSSVWLLNQSFRDNRSQA